MLITSLIASLLVDIAVPSLRYFVVNSKLITGTNNLAGVLNLAGSEAVTRWLRVSICPRTNSTDCTGTSGNQGWIAFMDQALPGAVDGTDVILPVNPDFAEDVDLPPSGPPCLQFPPMGSRVDHCDIKVHSGGGRRSAGSQGASRCLVAVAVAAAPRRIGPCRGRFKGR